MIDSTINFVASTFGLVTPVDWVMFIGIGLLVNFVTALVMHRLVDVYTEEVCVERYESMDDGIRYTTQEDCELVWKSQTPFLVKLLFFMYWPWSLFIKWLWGRWIFVPVAFQLVKWDYSIMMAILMPVKILFNLVSYAIIVVMWFIYMTIMITR